MAINLPIVSTFDGRGVTGALTGIKNLGAKLLGFGALVAGAFVVREVVQFGRAAIEAAEGVQIANNRLEAVAKATNVFGANTAIVTDRLIKFAEAQEMIIGQDAEMIKGVQAVLLSFKSLSSSAGTVGGNFDRATKAAFDMAAVLQKDASSQAMALAKALEDPVTGLTALRKAGTLFTDQQKEQVKAMVAAGDLLGAQNLILAEVESQYGGAAEATATWSQKLTLAFDNVKEAAGKALLPAFEQFAKYVVEEVIPPVTAFFEDDFPGILTAMEPLLTGFTENMGDVADTIKEFLGIDPNTPLIEGVLGKLGELKDNPEFQEFLGNVSDLMGDMFDIAGPLATDLLEISNALAPILKDAANDAGGALGDIASIIADVSAILSVFSGKPADAAEEVDGFSKTMEYALSPIKLVLDLLSMLADWFDKLRERVEENRGQIQFQMEAMQHVFTSGFDDILGSIQGTFETMGTVFTNAWNNLFGITDAGTNKQVEEVTNTGPMMFSAATGMMMSLFQGALQVWEVIKAWFATKPMEISAFFGNAWELLRGIGSQIMQGLLNGLRDAWKAIETWVNDKVNWIKNAFKKAMKIGSPSKVFYEYGQNIVEGLALGMDSLSPEIDASVAGMVPSTPGAVFGAGAGGVGSTYNITVNAGMGANGAKLGEEIVAAIKRYERTSGKVFASA